MENAVGVKVNDDRKFEETMADKISFSYSTPHLSADPLVYKLVRVCLLFLTCRIAWSSCLVDIIH